jgi:hypothetical protein
VVRFEDPLFRALALVLERLLCERELDRGFAVERPLDELRAFELRVVELRLEAPLFVLRFDPLFVCWAMTPPRGVQLKSVADSR